MKVNREELLKQLESVLPGLSTREIVEQSTCFVFTDRKVFTFNEEICCSMDTGIDLCGAIQSAPLLALLRKLPEEFIGMTVTDESQLRVTGKRRRAGIHMENEILLPIDGVDEPGKWKKLPKDFLDGLEMVEPCASKNEQEFATTCIHLTPDYMEAMNNSQIARFTTPTKLKEDALIRRDSLKHIVQLGVTHFSRTKTWMHYKNPAGLVISCRMFEDEFQDLDEFVQVTGKKVTFPKAILGAIEKAKVFTDENSEDNHIVVSLDSKSVMISGEGPSGWFQEKKKVKYKGKPISFGITPEMLVTLVKSNQEARVSTGQLIVQHGKLTYTAHLLESK